jgi:hypothetical protein
MVPIQDSGMLTKPQGLPMFHLLNRESHCRGNGTSFAAVVGCVDKYLSALSLRIIPIKESVEDIGITEIVQCKRKLEKSAGVCKVHIEAFTKNLFQFFIVGFPDYNLEVSAFKVNVDYDFVLRWVFFGLVGDNKGSDIGDNESGLIRYSSRGNIL